MIAVAYALNSTSWMIMTSMRLSLRRIRLRRFSNISHAYVYNIGLQQLMAMANADKKTLCRTGFLPHIILTRWQCHTAAAEGAKLSTIYKVGVTRTREATFGAEIVGIVYCAELRSFRRGCMALRSRDDTV